MHKNQTLHILTVLMILAVLVLLVLYDYGFLTASKAIVWQPWGVPAYSVMWQRLSPASLENVAWIVMTSSVTKELHLSQLRTWLGDMQHVWAFSDEYDGLFVHTLPSIYGKSTYQDAQHRQLRGMQWLYRNRAGRLRGVEWLFLIDDDTWVNMPVFSRLLPLLDPNSSVIYGYNNENGMYNGGAGMLLSRRAFDIITPHLYSDACPFALVNDDTVTACARRFNVTIMHSGLFSYYPVRIDRSTDFIEQVTVHPVKDHALVEAMTYTSAKFYL
jgi:hypothetical protein